MDTLQEAAKRIVHWNSWAPDWLEALILVAAALLAAWAAHRVIFALVMRSVQPHAAFWRPLVQRVRWLSLLILLVLAAGLALGAAPLGDRAAAFASRTVVVCLIGAAAVGIHIAMNVWMAMYLRRFEIDSADNLLARKHVTQVRILRRIADTLITIIAIAAMLMTSESVRRYGISLLASAGAAGLVAGLALQPLLKNLFAGIQLAVTQPIRIDDALLVEGEWGNVEEITSTYVVVRIWDLRRLILPLSYFIEKPFQNWTRESANLIGSIMLFLDYRAPMEAIRARVQDLVERSPLWDRQVVNVQVTDARETTIQVRILASARNSSQAWDLRCYIREQIIQFLQDQHPEALPRTRAQIESVPEESA